MSNCIPCTKGVPKSMIELITLYKAKGLKRWFYRIDKGDWIMCTPESFGKIHTENLKLNTKKKERYEYFSIEEFRRM